MAVKSQKVFLSKKQRKNVTPKSNEQFFSQTHMVVSYAFQIWDSPIQVLLLKHVFLRCLKKNNNQWSLVEAVWSENSDRIFIGIVEEFWLEKLNGSGILQEFQS